MSTPEFFAANIARALLNARFGDERVDRVTRRTVEESLVPSVLPVIEEEIERRVQAREQAELAEARTQTRNALQISALMLEALGGRHVITDADADRVDTFPEVFIERRGFDRILTLGMNTLKENP